ncbi:hypothetical protein [Kitasatospora sp. NPDC093679]|uniref:hypothetical protein n=1 Tax=Kitasatospora sp. NPDC093679 TaxID=3154983 RepID=UPI0034300652
MTENTNTAPDRVSSTETAPLLPARTALVLLIAAVIGIVAGVLTFLGHSPVATAVLSGLTAAGASVPVLHKLIR